MIVPGCLLAVLLPLGGAALGQRLDGSEGGLFGLAIEQVFEPEEAPTGGTGARRAVF